MSLRRLLILSVVFLHLVIVISAQQLSGGVVLPVMLSTSLNSLKNKPGDKVTGRLMQDVVLPDGEKLRAGARIEGSIVEVSQATGTVPARLKLRFSHLAAGQKQFAISVRLRALASMNEVFNAQLPWNTFDDYGTSSSDWNTVQVGGAVVYRGDGTVRSAMEIIGKATDSGAVTAKLMPAPRLGCPKNAEESQREQSLWIFSPWACSTYGFEDLAIAQSGASAPAGTIELTSPKKVSVRAGSGWLLVLLPPSGAGRALTSD